MRPFEWYNLNVHHVHLCWEVGENYVLVEIYKNTF